MDGERWAPQVGRNTKSAMCCVVAPRALGPAHCPPSAASACSHAQRPALPKPIVYMPSARGARLLADMHQAAGQSCSL